ncbi:MAG: 2-oxo acid dehydrogenase subunit E2 [Verrucomicrobia bacterium]|nr:2-oxo acid dehydrogenase subunit E2 [Verrucomicrobiota bacterium]
MAAPITMPSFGMYTADGTLVSWLHPAGTAVKEGQPVLEIETEKATHEVPAPASGKLHHVLSAGAELKEQMIIGYVLGEGEKAPVTVETRTPAKSGSASDTGSSRRKEAQISSGKSQSLLTSAATGDGGWIKASPLARRLASERGIQLTSLRGSGPGGRIVEADVLAAAGRAPVAVPAGNPVIPISWRVRERIPFTGIRRIIAGRLKQSQSAAVSLTLQREVWAKQLTEARAELNHKTGASVPFDAFFVKFLALALRERPELNAVISGDELVLLDEVNIGFACSVPGGLSVPVIHGADKLSIAEIGKRIRELAERARAGQSKAADLEGGTATITNLGGFGVDGFTPVLNPPQSSILGIGRILPRPVSDSGIIRVLPTVWLSLTFDHRVTDGVPAAQLLDAIARQMNDERHLQSLIETR